MDNVQQEVEIWQCEYCHALHLNTNTCQRISRHHEEKVWCWECGKGEMIYQGKRLVPAEPVAYDPDNRSTLRRCLEFIPRLFMSTD